MISSVIGSKSMVYIENIPWVGTEMSPTFIDLDRSLYFLIMTTTRSSICCHTTPSPIDNNDTTIEGNFRSTSFLQCEQYFEPISA